MPDSSPRWPGPFMAVFILLLFAMPAFAIVPEGKMKIYAVTTDGQGLAADLDLKIEPGTGKIWSSVTPLVGTTTQNAEKVAVGLAHRYFPATDRYDYKFSINSDAAVVDGPSAGAAMALLTISLLTDNPVPDSVSMTGTISEEGGVGPVGGVFEKAREASRIGTKLFMIPKGEAVQTVKMPDGVKSVNIIDYAPKNWGMKVVEVQTIDDAIRLSHTKIEQIDVNAGAAQAVPEFVPEKLALGGDATAFKSLTTGYIGKTKQRIAEARNALSSSLLEDGSLTQQMVDILNNSEQTMSRADVLNEQNYLYSAANFAFLANVNANIVKDVSNDPALLDPQSPSLDIKLVELRRELSTFENDLGGEVPRQGIEWLASAQQRFTYARNTVDRLSTEETIVVGGTDADAKAAALRRLQDYEFAVSWLDVSKDFYHLSKASDDLVPRSGAFSGRADAAIQDANSAYMKLKEGDPSAQDIKRRLDAAVRERDMNWFEAAVLDAASARALSEADAQTQDMNHDGLQKLLTAKISSVDAEINDGNTHFGWGPLYEAHAKYFLASAAYYDNAKLGDIASDNLSSGYGLALLAQYELEESSKMIEAYSKLPAAAGQKGTAGEQTQQAPAASAEEKGLSGLLKSRAAGIALVLVAVCAVLAVALAAITIMLRRHAQQHGAMEAEASGLRLGAVDEHLAGMEESRAGMRELRRRFLDGAITTEEFRRKAGEHATTVSALGGKLAAEMGAGVQQGAMKAEPSARTEARRKAPPQKSGRGGKRKASGAKRKGRKA